jgi:Peptidase family M23
VLPIAYPASLERTQPAATVRLPSDHPLRVVWGGHRLATNRHAASAGQRWAYDLVIAPAGTGATELTDYGCFGTPVLAPIGATVHQAHDGDADIAIGTTLADPQGVLGNHAILKLESGTYLVIAHLKQGSVKVKTGDAVVEGQLLGECGNSGNTSEPHIHIHHQKQDPLSINGDLNLGVNLVEGLPLYFRDHDGAAMPVGGIKIVGEKFELIGDVVTHGARK